MQFNYKGYALVQQRNCVHVCRYAQACALAGGTSLMRNLTGDPVIEHVALTRADAEKWVDQFGFQPVLITLGSPNDVRNFRRIMEFVRATSESSVFTQMANELIEQIPVSVRETVPA